MAEFAIQRGPTPLYTWDVDKGSGDAATGTVQRGGLLVVGEAQPYAFVVTPVSDEEYRILIGDVPIAELVGDSGHPAGLKMLGQRVWPEYPYFESARGETV